MYNQIYPTLNYADATPTLVAANIFSTISDVVVVSNITSSYETDYCASATSIEKETEEEEFAISPNPSNGLVKVTVEDRKRVYQLKIVNSNGTEVKTGEPFHQMQLVDLRGFSVGLYVFILFEGNEFISSKKVIIEK